MSNDRYEKIRKALEMGPTPGEWYWSDAYPTQDGRKTWSLIGDGGFGILSCDGDENSPQSVNFAAAELIAACDPDTIRALLDERDALAAEVERLAEALRKLEERAQRDEALLRQALEALELRCGTNADERKELIPALRERLGEKE